MRWLIFALLAGILAGCGPGLNNHASGLSGAERRTGPAAWPDVSASTPIQKTGGQDVALIVAIEDYAFLPDVPGAVKNAEDWRGFLEVNLGVKSVYTLYDQKASQEEILRFADKAASEVGQGGRIWFVFVGHGAPSSQGEGMLVGMDAQQTVDSLHARSARQADVVAKLKKGLASDIVLVVDACFSGQDSGGGLLAKGSQPVIPVANPRVPTGVTVLSAARSNEFAGALPDTERPAFSYLLLGAMRGWADAGDQVVSASEAIEWTRSQLTHVTGRTQTPEFAGNGALLLTKNVQEPDPGIADMMRGVIHNASTGAERYDTGKGLSFIPPQGWTLYSSIPADFYEESLTEVVSYNDDATDSSYMLQHMRKGARAIASNVKVMNDAFSNKNGGRMLQQKAIEVDRHQGLYQRWRVTNDDGAEKALVAVYITDGDDLWFSFSSTPIERESWLFDVNQQTWNSFEFY